MTGAQDELVDPGNGSRLAARLQHHGVPARVVTYANLGHRTLPGALATPLRGLGPVLDDVAGFVRQRSADHATGLGS